MPLGKSTILSLQESVFRRLDPNINAEISEDQTMLRVTNVSEEIFPQLIFITNSPEFQNSYMFLDNIKVYLDDNKYHTDIYGLLPILGQVIQNSDANAYTNNQKTHQPFINGFQNGINIGQLIDTLSSLSVNTPDTYGRVKTFTLFIDPIDKRMKN